MHLVKTESEPLPPVAIKKWEESALELPKTYKTLVAARNAIAHSVELQRLFENKNENLAADLESLLPKFITELDGLADVALYLAKEDETREKDHALIIDPDSGLPLAQVPFDQLVYQGPQVEREDEFGNVHLVTPLPMLHPQIQAEIKLFQFNRETEIALTAHVEEKLKGSKLSVAKQTAKVVTRKGRKELGGQLYDMLNLDCLVPQSNLATKIQTLVLDISRDVELQSDLYLTASTVISKTDLMALNLEFNLLKNQMASIQRQWLELILAQVAKRAEGEIEENALEPGSIVVTNPGLDMPKATTVIVQNVSPFLSLGKAKVKLGAIELESNERPDAWTVYARVYASVEVPQAPKMVHTQRIQELTGEVL